MRYYSPTTGSTYLSGIHVAMPDDVVPITEERFLEVIGRPAPGKIRSHDENGLPILVDPAPATADGLATAEREWRDSVLAQAVWLRDRHRDQLEIGGSTTLTAEQFQELLVYMQALRDWPQSPDFPVIEQRPAAPPWIADQTE